MLCVWGCVCAWGLRCAPPHAPPPPCPSIAPRVSCPPSYCPPIPHPPPTQVICLDDYHCLDRNGRKEAGVTALAPEAQNFELMYQQVCVWGGVRGYCECACVFGPGPRIRRWNLARLAPPLLLTPLPPTHPQ